MSLSSVKKILKLEKNREELSRDMESLTHYGETEEQLTSNVDGGSPQDEAKVNLGRKIKEALPKL